MADTEKKLQILEQRVEKLESNSAFAKSKKDVILLMLVFYQVLNLLQYK